MDYRVFSMSSGEDDDSAQAHVFARAYRWAWCSIYGADPTGRHDIPELGLAMEFGQVRVPEGASHANAASTARSIESASPATDLPPGGRHDD